MVSLLVWLNVLILGKQEGTPLTGFRKHALAFIYRIHVHLMAIFGFFTRVKWQMVSADEVGSYEEYLGTPDQ